MEEIEQIKQKNREDLTKEDKLLLLRNFLNDDIYTKAIIDTLDDIQLNNWINKNLDTILVK